MMFNHRPVPEWWVQPRRICILVDNDSWILPFVERLVTQIQQGGDYCVLVRWAEDVPEGAVTFLLGCTQIAPPNVLARSRFSLVVHESDLPKGRGFAPMSWAVIEGASKIAVCLLEATDDVDAGSIYRRTTIELNGTELNSELRHLQGEATIKLCLDFLKDLDLPTAEPQIGEPNWYPRRRPADSQLDPEQTLSAQFDLLRVVDNERYPAFFEFRGRRYQIKIDDIGPIGEPPHDT